MIGGSNGRRSRCRVCDRAANKKWKETSNYYQNNRDEILRHKRESYCPITQKNYNLQSKYGITIGDFMEMFEKQNGQCKLCNCEVERFSKVPTRRDVGVVDHDHITGRVRGILCQTCNRALGLFHDDYNLLLKAAEYLKNDT